MTDHVEVTGTGTASAAPDVVAVDVRIQVDDAAVAGALSGLTSRLTATVAAAADHGVDDTDRRTTSMTVSPRWDREGRAVEAYQATQSLRVRIRDRDRVGDVLAALAGAAGDAFGVDGVSLEVSDPAPLLARARAAAFADARSRAEQYATLAGRALGEVRHVVEAPDPGGPVPRMRPASTAAGSGVPIEGGESTVEVTVLIRFGLGSA